MLTDEDIEALLYAQVYHGKSAEDNASEITVAREDISNTNDQEEYRDDNIRQQENDDQPANLQLTPDSTQTAEPHVPLNNLQCSEISTSTARTASLDSTQIPVPPDDPIGDQLPINQNFCPRPPFFVRLQKFKTKFTWSDKCEQALRNIQAGLINEKQFFKILRRISFLDKKRIRQEQKRQATICSEIVYLSDSSGDSDIEIVTIKKKNMEEVTQISDSGSENDDIIYVEPPPVPVIDVGDETDDNEVLPEEPPVEAPSLHIDEEASNDFLPAATTSAENFNFSLHGSEFQDAEFVRPANPTDHYETESSTSTSDFNRDSSREFSNTVKTIVFNEVDFPKDIFDDSNNLEKFGELITPKRKNKSVNSDDGLNEAGTSGCKKRISQRKLSESSSESDYDASESHQHLPHLSPMVSVGSSPTKKCQNSVQNKERPLEENLGTITEEDTGADKKSKKKRKKKNTGDTTAEDLEKSDDPDVQATSSSITRSVQLKLTAPVIETEELPKKTESPKKNVRKKNKRQQQAARVAIELQEETERIVGDLMTRKGRTRWLLRSQKSGEQSTEPIPMRKKKKKKKKNQATENLIEQNSSSKENRAEDGEVVQDKDKVMETVEKNSIQIDDDDDILLIEEPIPLHVIESSESEDDVISLGLVEELQLANIESENKLEDFDLENIQSKMSDDPLKWQVNTKDINKVKTPASGPRCRRCKQAGHIAIRCPNKQELPKCFLCGFEGHEEPRCKNKVCFTCGASGSFSTVYCYRCVNQRKVKCSLCHLMGHSSESCPDLWRRYHSTTKRGPVVVPKENRLKPKNQRWCSGCAENGHLEFQCRSYRWLREYPVSSPIIFGYGDVYNSKVDEPVEKAFDLREVLDLNRDNTDLRKKLDDRRKNSSTNSTAPTTDTTRTDDADNNTNVQSLTSQTSTEAPSEPSELSEAPLTENPIPPEAPQSIQVCQPENPDPHPSAERIQPKRSVDSHNQQDMNRNKSKKTRKNRNRRPNPVSFMNNRNTAYDGRNIWLGMGNGPYSNQVQQFSHQPQQFQNQFHNFPNQFQPYPNQIQQLNLFNPIPANMLHNNYYQPPRYYDFDFAQDVVPWNNNNPQMPINSRLNFCEPQPLMDIAVSVPNSRHLPVENFSRDFSDAPFTITREPSPRLLDFSGPQQSALVSASLGNQPFDGFAPRQQEANVCFHNPSLPVVSLDGSVQSFSSPKDNEGFKLREGTAEKFLTWQIEELQNFLKSELKKLGSIKNLDPRIYKKKLSVVNQLRKVEVKTNAIKKQLFFHFKHINMYLFGIHKLQKGRKYLDLMRNFVKQPGKCSQYKRASLQRAFDYIFGGEHPCCDYMKHLNMVCMKSLFRRDVK